MDCQRATKSHIVNRIDRHIPGEIEMGNPAGMRMKKKEKRRKKQDLRLAAKAAAAPTAKK